MRTLSSVVPLVLGLVLLVVTGGTAAASPSHPADGAGCESTEALSVSYLPDDGIQIRRNDCGLAVRSVSYSRYTTNVPLTGFPSGPMKFNRWNCGDPATGVAETSSQERFGDWLVTYAKGWQVRRGDGRWHVVDVVYTVTDHGFVSGRPFATDACHLDPQDDDWDDDYDDGFRPG